MGRNQIKTRLEKKVRLEELEIKKREKKNTACNSSYEWTHYTLFHKILNENF